MVHHTPQALRDDGRPVLAGETCSCERGMPLTGGCLLVFFAALDASTAERLTSAMTDPGWSALPKVANAASFAYDDWEHLEQVLESVALSMSPADRSRVRAALIPEVPGSATQLARAVQHVEYLSETLSRVRSGWLFDLLAAPQRMYSVVQPLVDIDAGTVRNYEMLLRAHPTDDSGRPVSGGQIFDAAFATKRVYEVDELARDLAIRTAARDLPADAKVFVNFMPNRILDPARSLERTLETCARENVSPDRVVFEVVESESVKDVGYLRGILDGYRSRGFRLALDDLGSGYAGINTMLGLMPDFIKLDRLMVDGCSKDTTKRIIIGKLIEAAREMNIQVVAEGVELYGDFAAVRDLGAHLAQGYLFARPAPDSIFPSDHNLLASISASPAGEAGTPQGARSRASGSAS